jgi:glycine cleavage system transcriptional repressor
MKECAILSALGSDRVGIADDLSAALARIGVEIEESRMATLGGQFAIIMRVCGEAGRVADLHTNLNALGAGLGFHLELEQSGGRQPSREGSSLIVECYSMGAPGIGAVAAILKKHNVNIEDMETDASSAPWSR